jgi:MYXO-CTERM domain-containing protein
MRSTRVLSLVAASALVAAFGCSSPSTTSEYGASSQALLTEPVLNEVVFNPAGTDNPYEFVELKGPAGLNLTGYSIAYVEGDNNTNLGKAIVVWPLTGSIGANGLYIVRAAAGHTGLPAATTVQDETSLGAAGQLQNDSGTVILVKGASLTVNANYNVSGALALPAGVVLLDSVSITDGGATDVAFGPLVRSASGTPDAVSRFLDDDDANSLAAWYGGDIAGTLPTDVAYSATACTAIMPAAAAITPGAPNLAKPLAVDGGTAADASVAVDAGSVQDASVAGDAGTAPVDAGSSLVDASYPPAATDPYLNEILLNPASTDGPWEYIEIKGAPGASVSGFQIAYIDGDSTQIGIAKLVIPLNGDVLGSAGFLVAKSNLQGHTLPAGCTLRSDNAFDATNGCLENGTGTFVLVRGAALVQGSDYDTNDDGTLDLPAGAVVVDAVSLSDGGSTDKAHGPVVSTASGTQPGGVSRLVGNTSRAAATAWFGATISGTVSSTLVYDASNATANMPAGAALTPGAENSQGGPGPVDAGAPVTDAGARDAGAPVVDAGPRDAGTTPAADAGSPAVDAGARDAGSISVDAGAPSVDAGPKADAGTVPPEQTFGEDESKGCGCAVVGTSHAGNGGLAWVALAGFVVLAARRRRS